MSYEEYLMKIQDIQCKFLWFIEREDNKEENYQNLIDCIDEKKILENKYEFKSILYLISNVSKYSYRGKDFFSKIQRILKYYIQYIKSNYTNLEIFSIFKDSYNLILFFIQEKIIIIDEIIQKLNDKMASFLKPEIDEIIHKLPRKINDISQKFDENRKSGENDNDFYRIIREDLIEDFIIYVKKNDYPLDSKIEHSMFETHPLLLNNKITTSLIQYAAFFGSVQIFKYLYLNDAIITNEIWIYCIYGNNAEIFNFLIEKKQIESKKMFESCYLTAIRCHHNDMANYIEGNFFDSPKQIYDMRYQKFLYALRHHNYQFFLNECENKPQFYAAIKYNHYVIVEHFVKYLNFDINVFSIVFKAL